MNSKSNGEKDEDQVFIEQLLDKFYEFDNGAASKKKLKKKKRKRCEEEEEEEEFTAVKDVCCKAKDDEASHPGAEQQQQQQQQQQQSGSTVPQVSQVEVVTFQDSRKKKLKTNQTPASLKTPAPQIPEKKQSDDLEEINLEKARLEVHRFGITGYKKEQQRVFEKDRAIMLGARPPKKDYLNYKLLQRQIQEKKQKSKEDVQPDLKKKKKQNNQRDRKKVSSGSGSTPSGQVGRFKNGLLVLSSKEIQKIKGNKRSR